MELINRVASVAVLGALSLALSGCMDVEGQTASNANGVDPNADQSGFMFQWTPETEDYGYMLELVAGPQTECTAKGSRDGALTHESGLGGFTILAGFIGTASRHDDSAHLGPANSAHYSGPLWAETVNAAYAGGWKVPASNGSSALVYSAAMHTYHQEDNSVSVDCDGPAWMRFSVADAIEPIRSSTATGGVGAEAGGMSPIDSSAGVNLLDAYSIETKGDHALLFASSRPIDSPLSESFLQGEIRLHWPSSEETLPLAPDSEGNFYVMRTGSDPGEYTVELDRIAVNYNHLKGALMGFVLHTELGDPTLSQSQNLAAANNTACEGTIDYTGPSAVIEYHDLNPQC